MRTGLILTLALALTSSALAQAPASTPTSNDAEEIKATLVAMWSAVEKGDLERYGSYLHPKFTTFGESDVYLASGKEVEMRSYADYLSRAENIKTEMHQAEVTVIDRVAWITYYWTDSGMIGGERSTSRGKSTRIFVKEDGKWLCIHGHYTAVP